MADGSEMKMLVRILGILLNATSPTPLLGKGLSAWTRCTASPDRSFAILWFGRT